MVLSSWGLQRNQPRQTSNYAWLGFDLLGIRVVMRLFGVSRYVTSCYVRSCHVMLCHSLLCHVMSRCVMSCLRVVDRSRVRVLGLGRLAAW